MAGMAKNLKTLPSRRYNAPGVKVGRCFVRALSIEIAGIRARLWNAEWFTIFKRVIL